MKFAEVRKAQIAVGGVCAALGVVLADGQVSITEVGVLATAVATAVGVFWTPNAKPSE
jgi:hypothetical protein